MYPKNAASPERISIGPVVQISDGAVQTSGVSVKVLPQGTTASAGGGTVAYEEGIVHYTPTQAETNYTSFVLIAYKTGCIPATTTVVTSASATAGTVLLAPTTHTSAVIPTVTTVTTTTTATNLTNLPSIPAGWLTAAGIASGALDGRGNWNVGKTGYSLTATTGLGNQTANITGNLSGSVGSVTGAVGSVTGAVGSVTGSVGSVTGAVGSVTGNVGGNVVGSVGSVVGHTPQTGDSFARLGAPAGVSVSADVAAIKAQTGAIEVDTADIQGRLPAGLVSGRMVVYVEAMANDVMTAAAAAADLTTELQSGLATASALSTVAGYIDTEVAAILAAVDTEVAAIKAKTDNLPAAPAATGDIPSASAIADAVWDEVLSGHLTAGSTGTALNAAGSAGDPWATALPGAYGAGTAGKIIGDNIDAAISSISGGGLDAAGVRAAIGLASANLDTQLSTIDTAVDAILVDTAEIGTAGAGLTALASQSSVNTIDGIVDAILLDTAEIGTAGAGLTALASAANLSTIAGYLDTEIAAILADTNQLQTDWANGGRLDLILDARASQTAVDDLPTNAELATALGTADDAVLAQVALVKAKTDLIPASPAATGDIPSASAVADAVWDEALSGHSSAGTAGLALSDADLRGARTVIRGTVSNSTTPSVTQFTSSSLSPAGTAADQFKGRILIFDNATTTPELRGQATDITASSAAANPLFTFTALTTAPVSGDTFSIV